MNLPERLKDIIAGQRGKLPSETEIAEKLGVSKASVSNWLAGKEVCPEHHLARFIEVFADENEPVKRLEFIRLYLLLGIQKTDQFRTGKNPEHQKWSPYSRKLARESLEDVCEEISHRLMGPTKKRGRTMADFPGAFLPLAIVTGDKREDSRAHISAADFGVVSASPAELRWLPSIRFPNSVEIFSDKLFVLDSYDRLKEKFGKKHLFVIGSPASNHLARRLHLSGPESSWQRAAPIFRFNVDQSSLNGVESLLHRLLAENPALLVGRQGDPNTSEQLKFWCHSLFHGGILDPTYSPIWIRAVNVERARDFGLISFARNPFSDAKEPYFCILAAGSHMFGTAHAVRFLSQPEKFKEHPYGGVLRVDVDLNRPFTDRFDTSQAEWDTKSSYNIEKLAGGLKTLENDIPAYVRIDNIEAREGLQMMQML